MTQPHDPHHAQHSSGMSRRSQLSADQIRNPRLRDAAIGRRGYRREDVEQLLGRIAAQVEERDALIANLQAEIHQLRNHYRTYYSARGIDLAALDKITGTRVDAVAVVMNAQQVADQLVEDARAQARSMAQIARAEAEATIARARADAEQAARTYRATAGPNYSPDREQLERVSSVARSVLSALNGATNQMHGATEQMNALTAAFAAELGKLTGHTPVRLTRQMRGLEDGL